MKLIYMIVLQIILASTMTSCSTVTPFENFKNFLKNNVGKRTDDPTSDVACYPQLLVSSKSLPNGNTENKYQWYGNCFYYYEVEKTTNKIVEWRYEGSESDCAIPP